ncbi:MAG: hypothetical protein ACREMF_11340 [Gemmatimonadales bacterium]
MDHESLVIILSLTGPPLVADMLDELPDAQPVWVRLEREGTSVCLAARMRHCDQPAEFRARVRGWGAARGWAVTVAPCAPSL